MTYLTTLGGLAVAVLVGTSAPALAQTPAPTLPATPPAYGPPISTADAQALLQRALELSRAQGLKAAIAIVEPSGELVAFVRMDDVPYGSIPLAQAKARTAARFRTTTAAQEERVQDGRLSLLSAEDFVTIGGGAPIVIDGRVVGAVGISGGTSAQDAALAAEVVAPR